MVYDIPSLENLERRESTNTEFLQAAIARLSAHTQLTDPTDPQALVALLRQLYRAGRFDLAVGRLFEGHVDALQIIDRYGPADLAATLRRDAVAGRASFGVWNAPWLDRALTCQDEHIHGGKAFASGAGVLSHALITLNAGETGRMQLLLADLQATPPCVETGWWDIVGMRASETHRVYWHDVPIERFQPIGGPGDYERLPWFATGALRFVAVQAGGIAAVFDEVRAHLKAAQRATDPHQRRRLARLFTLAQSAAAICRDSAEPLFSGHESQVAAQVAHARSAVYDLAEEAIMLAQQSVGVAALFNTHPLSRVLTDLMVYLRQPGPDAQRMAVADAAVAGDLEPGL
ncbi:acyl-CoA dehydrogenase family protein [Salinisphaera sp. SPP-AMP-43]|uniref:acyl-CoA dehydrogenase family protein n=1 Tax=Salinisphaera sp. SPP-AMP-43 TaxID=3121288 RepID=UPI003C6E5D50